MKKSDAEVSDLDVADLLKTEEDVKQIGRAHV